MTSSPTVIVHTDAPKPALGILAHAHPDLPLHACETYEDLPDLISSVRAEVVYTVRFDGTVRFPRQSLMSGESVKWVSVGGSGTDHLGDWDPQRVTVTNAAGVAADSLAEYVIGMMLAFSMDLRGFASRQRDQQWAPKPLVPIRGKTILILGMGKTGQAIAARAKAMRMKTIGVRASAAKPSIVDEQHGPESLLDLIPRADFIVCCLPLSPTTRSMIDARAFASMKPSAVLIDISRGGIVDESALIAALDEHRIQGAALDVFSTEPLPRDHKLWTYENVILTPHCASVYEGWDVRAIQMFAENLERYRIGEALENVVDPGRGY